MISNFITQAGDSALMWAVSEGRTDIVPLLVKGGASLDLMNEVIYSELAKKLKYEGFVFLHSLNYCNVHSIMGGLKSLQ